MLFNRFQRLEHQSSVFLYRYRRNRTVKVRLFENRIPYSTVLQHLHPFVGISIEVNEEIVVPRLTWIVQQPLGDSMTGLYASINRAQPFIHQYVQSLHIAPCRSFYIFVSSSLLFPHSSLIGNRTH